MKKLMTATKDQLEKALEYHQKKYEESTRFLIQEHHLKMTRTITKRIKVL
jgi:hypothetical protein